MPRALLLLAGGTLLIGATLYAARVSENLEPEISREALMQSARIWQRHFIRQMSWVDTADPEQMARRDIAAKHFRFFEVCGYACEALGIDDAPDAKCYPPYPGIKRQVFEGTGDNVGGELARLQRKAEKFSSVYNLRIAQHLSAHGTPQCPAGAG